MATNDQQQQQLRDAYEARQNEIREAAARIYQARGDDLEKQAAIRDLDPMPDPQAHREAAHEMAQVLAENGVRSPNFEESDLRGVPEEGIRRAEEKRAAQEQAAEQAPGQENEPRSEPSAHQPEATPERQAEADPAREPVRSYADLKREHSGQETELPRKQLEFAEDRAPARSYADLKREHEEAGGRGGEDGRKKLEFAEDREAERAPESERNDEGAQKRDQSDQPRQLSFHEDRNPAHKQGIEH